MYGFTTDDEYSKKIFKLPPIPTLLISIPSFALVIYVLAKKVENTAISYAAYLLSAYAMVITITGVTEIVRFIRQGIDNHPLVKKALSIPLFEKYLKEVMFRTKASLYQGLFINLLYVALKFGSGIYYHSIWFACSLLSFACGPGIHAFSGNCHVSAVWRR